MYDVLPVGCGEALRLTWSILVVFLSDATELAGSAYGGGGGGSG